MTEYEKEIQSIKCSQSGWIHTSNSDFGSYKGVEQPSEGNKLFQDDSREQPSGENQLGL